MGEFKSSDLFPTIELLSRIDPSAALAELKRHKDILTVDEAHRVNYCALLINLGDDVKISELVREGIGILEQVVEQANEKEIYYFHALYNLGNGYQSLANLEWTGADIPPDIEQFQLSKRAYRRALGLPVKKIGREQSALLTNYANVLAMCGRHFDALVEYDKAIQADPSHSMAIGNKGIELSRYASLSGSHSGALHAEAFDLLSIAAEDAILDASGLGHARKRFADARDQMTPHIEHFRTHLEEEMAYVHPRVERTDFETGLHDFAKEYDLFLNLCVHDWECRDVYRDSLFFDYVTDLDDMATFPRLARYFNQIKEDYSTARYVLHLAHQDDDVRKRVSTWTSYADLLEYATYGLQSGLAKSAVAQAFNVLDKIAVFLSLELGIGESERGIYFSSMWRHRNSTSLRPEIREVNDMNLVALYDLSLDLKERPLSRLADLRRRISHRHIVAHDLMMYVGDGSVPEDHIMFDDLIHEGIAALKMAKSAIVYLAAYLNQRYREDTSDGLLRMPLPVLWQEDWE